MVTERGRGGGGGVGCNRVHDLHIVFVLLYPVCRSVSDLSCLDVIQSLRMFYVILFLGVTKRRCVRPRERARGNTNGLSLITTINPPPPPPKKKTGITGYGSFIVPYFQPATSIDGLRPRDAMADEKRIQTSF